MKGFAVRSLAFALALAAGTVAAQDYYDDRGPIYDDGYSADQGYYADSSNGYGQPGDGYYGQPAAYGDPRDAAQGIYGGYGRDASPAYDVALVTSVNPIVQPGQPVSRQQCWNEPAPSYAHQDRRDPRYARRAQTSGGGALLGAIAGGVLGNSVGDGDGRKAATVIGAVLGGSIGNNIERNGSYRNDPYAYRSQSVGYGRDVQRCRVVTSRERDQRVVGYRVGYEYAGRQYETVTDYHPGSEIRVRVDVSPAG